MSYRDSFIVGILVAVIITISLSSYFNLSPWETAIEGVIWGFVCTLLSTRLLRKRHAKVDRYHRGKRLK